VFHVRDRRLVELLRPALLDHQAEVAVVVREDDDVAAGRLAARELALDLGEERGVVVDVLGVRDVDAELLLELLQRRVRMRLVVRVDVERPVREVQSLRERVVRASARRLRAAAAARGEKAGQGEDGAPRGRPLQQLPPCQNIGHADSSSTESTTNVASGFQLSAMRPLCAATLAGLAFWTYTVSRPLTVSTMY